MKQAIKLFICLVGLSVLSACSTAQKPINIVDNIKTPIFHPSAPTPVTMLPIKVQVMNLDKLKAVVTQAEENNKDVVLVVITTRDYEAISLNLQELKRYIQQQEKIIEYYRSLSEKNTSK